MGSFVGRRLVSLIPILIVVFTVVFMIIHLAPGDPAAVMIGEEATAKQVAALRTELGLDKPVLVQYFLWIKGAVKGDLGTSYFLDMPVTQAIAEHLPPTLGLAVIAELIGIFIAIPLGVIAAWRHATKTDRVITIASLVGVSVPSFLLALGLLLVLGVALRILPVGGYVPLSDGLLPYLSRMIMPGIALGVMQAALITRMSRSSMLDVLRKDYIRTARSAGVPERQVIFKNALRNAFLPILTVLGQGLGSLITGAVVTETIFNIPGLGQLVVNSVQHRDFPVVQGTVLFATLVFVLVNLAVDLLYGVFDPRVKLTGAPVGK